MKNKLFELLWHKLLDWGQAGIHNENPPDIFDITDKRIT